LSYPAVIKIQARESNKKKRLERTWWNTKKIINGNTALEKWGYAPLAQDAAWRINCFKAKKSAE